MTRRQPETRRRTMDYDISVNELTAEQEAVCRALNDAAAQS